MLAQYRPGLILSGVVAIAALAIAAAPARRSKVLATVG
jgi:hypothetical protein